MRLMANIRCHSKTGLYEYRRAVPADIRDTLGSVPGFPDKPGRTALTKSLGTRSKSEANRLAAALDATVEQVFKSAKASVGLQRTGPQPHSVSPAKLTPELVTKAFAGWVNEQAEEIKAALFNGNDDLGQYAAIRKNPQEWRALYHYERGFSDHGDNWRQIEGFDALLVAAAASQGLHLDPNKPVFENIRPIFANKWCGLLNRIEAFTRKRWQAADRWHRDGPSLAELEIAADQARKSADSRKGGQLSSLAEMVRELQQNVAVIDQAKQTAFAVLYGQWKTQADNRMKPRQVDQYSRVILDFAIFEGGVHVEAVDTPLVQRWVESLLAGGLSVKTIRSRISALKDYWNYLGSHIPAVQSHRPFEHVYLKEKRGKAPKRAGWQIDEVPMLWRKAKDGGKQTLADAIRIAAFTGARIESLFKLRLEDLKTAPCSSGGIPFFFIAADKTEAGTREIPVHPALFDLVKRLQKEAKSRDGYLLPSTAKNQYGERSVPVGKQFSRLKTALGYDKKLNFHSLRKTVASFWKGEKVWEPIAADIMGHAILELEETMTFGVYAGRARMEVLREAIEMLTYPDAEFMRG